MRKIFLLLALCLTTIFAAQAESIQPSKLQEHYDSECLKPKDLMVIEKTNNSAKITWTPGSEDQTQWRIRFKHGNGSWTGVNKWEQTSIVLAGLVTHDEYIVQVCAICGNKYSEYAEISFIAEADVTPCEVPTGLQVTSKDNKSATITWTAPSDQTRWYVARKSENQDQFYYGDYVGSKTITFQQLQPNTKYEVKVKAACDKNNESAYSESLFFTTDKEPCHMPIDLAVSGKTYNSATITWKMPENQTPAKWTVRYGKKGQSSTTATTTKPTFTMTGLMPETEYEFRVQANCDDSDNSNFSSYLDFTTEKAGAIVYTVYYNLTLTYYYDENYGTHTGAIEEEYDPSKTRFESYHENVLSAEIDESMKNVALTSMRSLFYGGAKAEKDYALKNMEFINGLQNLNTSELTDTYYMFYNCQSLESIDLRKFDMSKVTNAYRMFENCSALTTITCDDDWSQYTTLATSGSMFSNCNAIKGGKGTTYNSSHIDKSYARPDGGAAAPGYFTKDAERIPRCDLKGFEGKITYGMDWNKSVGSAISTGIVAVDAAAPYGTSANTWYLYKWNEDEGKWQAVNDATDTKLGSGRYYFRIQLIIPDDKRKEFYFSPDKNDLSVIVDDEVWTVTDMIGTVRSYIALANSHEFTLAKEISPIIAEAEEELEIWISMAEGLAMYLQSIGEKTKAEELNNVVIAAKAVLSNDEVTLEEVNASIATTSAAVEPYGELLMEFYKQGSIEELKDELRPEDSDACKKIIDDGVAAINALTWNKSKTFMENLMDFFNAVDAVYSKVDADLKAQREKDGQAIDQVTDGQSQMTHKFIRDGHLYLMYKGTMYNVQGAEVK